MKWQLHPLKRIRRLLQRPDRVRAAYKHVFLSPEGRIVLADLALKCGFYSEHAVVDNTNETFHRLGLRAMFLHVLAQLDQSDADLARAVRDGIDDAGEEAA